MNTRFSPLKVRLLAAEPFRCLALAALLTLAGGCRMWERMHPARQSAPVVLRESPTLGEILAAVENQANRVRQLKAEVQVSADGLPAAMRGDLMVERPDRLRLQAGVLGIPELGFDIGSNHEWFWIWKKASLPNDPPAFYYARHAEYEHSQLARASQWEPRWLLDALGLIEFRPTDRHFGPLPRSDGKIEIQTHSSTPAGNKYRVLVVDPQRAFIVQMSFYDQRGELIAYINADKHAYYPEEQVSLPHRVEIFLRHPDGAMTRLSVNINRFNINVLYGDPETMWQMPVPAGVPTYNLAAAAHGDSIRPEMASAEAQSRARDWYRAPY